MDASEMREMSTEELDDELDEAREDLMRLRFNKATGELTNHNQMRTARVKIARLLTVANERAGEEESDQEGEG
ncbi:MAG: 50S ribosomal protein L29 [Chloroflexi bacterium]|nr:50S ribosomal protein L29 [Chloroflexota bacterium]